MDVIAKIEKAKREQNVFLDIKGLNLEEIPNSLKELRFLSVIDIRNNQISDLSPLIYLPNLLVLLLDENQITDVSPLMLLPNLTNLSISQNQITDVSPLMLLPNLTNLSISQNQITDVSPLMHLTNLTNLSISQNQITDVSPLMHLTNLTNLSASYNQITDVLPLRQLTNLTNLSISNNKVFDASPIQQLVNLTNLNISNNQIQDINFIVLLEKITVLNFDQNPINSPPIEITYQGISSIKKYLRELEKGMTYLNEAKLIIVGDGGVGKTSIVHQLSDIGSFLPHSDSTHGIEISSLKLENNTKLNIWDFGGQEIYYSTHQLFLTNRSVYLFVFDSRRESNSLSYWLNMINILSGNSPVILVLNKIDQFKRDIPFQMLREQFPQIISYQKVSCLTNQGIPELKKIIEEAVNNLEHLKSPIPSSWLAVKDNLNDLRDNGVKHINFDEFSNICINHGIEMNSIPTLSSFLHDLGVILHFGNSLSLRNTIFLNYNFITDAIYSIIDDYEIRNKKGVLELSDLNRIWSELSIKIKSNELIELMIKFELCFRVDGHQFYIPQLFPADISDDFEWKSDFSESKFEFRYLFLPFGILTRFIVKMHHLIYENQFWKYGVVLLWDSTKALITESTLEKKIQIKILGKNKRELLNIIRNGFQEIHLSYNNLLVEEFIPCNCSECMKRSNPEFYDFQILRKYIDKSRKSIMCPYSVEDVQIEGLLGEVDVLTGEGENYLDQILKERGFDIPSTKNKDKE